VQQTGQNRSLRQLLQSGSGPVREQAGTSDISSASGNQPSWASNRSLRQLLQVFSESENRCRLPIPCRSCRRLRGGAQTDRNRSFRQLLQSGSAPVREQAGTSDISSASGNKSSWASNRSLRQLLQVFSESENRCQLPIPCRSCRRLRGGAPDRPQSQPSAAPTKWEPTCPRTGWYIRHIFSVRQQAFVGKRAYRVVIPPSFRGYLSAPDARAIHFMRRSSTRWANQAVVSLRVIFGLSRTMPGRMARGNGLPAALSASAKTSL